MEPKRAITILELQNRELRKLNNLRFLVDGYEYRLTYRGGFAPFISIDRRKIGARKFEYFPGLDAKHFQSADQALKEAETWIRQKIGKTGGRSE